MTMNEEKLRAIHAHACSVVTKTDRTLTPDVDAFWLAYLPSALQAMSRTVAAEWAEIEEREQFSPNEGVIGPFHVFQAGVRAIRAALASEATHADNAAVDKFFAAMKDKLEKSRAKGRSGWDQCAPELLSQMLRLHVEKGDPLDVANFCMMLWNLNAPIAPQMKGENQ